MIPISFSQIARAIDASSWGTSSGAWDLTPVDQEFTGEVVHDSRMVQPGDLYLALHGEVHNGHDFVGAALANGAQAILVDQDFVASTPTLDLDPSIVVLVVADTLTALGKLANLCLNQTSKLMVIAVTGSSGKTSTKDILAQILAQQGSTIAPPGSFNNDIGLPMTVLKVDHETKYLVLEMGARGLGHISRLTAIAPPEIGLVLNVGSAHAGEFGSIDATRRAKRELVESLPATGFAVLNTDDPNVLAMASATAAQVVTFGGSATADIQVSNIELDEMARPTFDLVFGSGITSEHTSASSYRVKLPLAGVHNSYNAAAAAAVALLTGVPATAIVSALEQVRSISPGRMNVIETSAEITIIDDSYNANVESMLAGLKALAQTGRGRTTWAVLGEMRELGENTIMAHDEIGRAVVRLGIDNLIVVGQSARPMFLAAAAEGFYNGEARFADTIEDAKRILDNELESGDVVFVKASRAANLDRLVAELVASNSANQMTS